MIHAIHMWTVSSFAVKGAPYTLDLDSSENLKPNNKPTRH